MNSVRNFASTGTSMQNIIKFNWHYFILTILLCGLEILIALFAHDKIIRPYIGDLFVVILLYCFVKSVANTPVFPTAVSVLLFSYQVEILQYFKIINVLGLQHSRLARLIIGTSFEWIDLIAYTAGIAIVLFSEKLFSSKSLVKVYSTH
jgi:hypothetical protein